MSETAEKTDPELWEKVKKKVQRGTKGGKKDEWSARKAQIAVQEYKHEGGGYVGKKDPDNHLAQWTKEEWGTQSGKESLETGERYLPKKAREALSDAEYRRSTAKKRADLKKGQQHSAQPKDVAEKTAKHRDAGGGPTKAELYVEAKKRDLPDRSKMNKAQLERALGR